MANIEIEFIRTYMSIQKKTAEFEVKLGALRDMRAGCKLGVSETNGALYIDQPSVFQGASRWFYGQNRYVVNEYLYREIMEKGGLIDLVVNLRDKCAELFMHCPDVNIDHQQQQQQYRYSTPTPVSNNTRKVFKAMCLTNIELLTMVGHGLGVLSHIYEPDPGETGVNWSTSFGGMCKSTLAHFQEQLLNTAAAVPSAACHPASPDAVIRAIQHMQRRIKLERIMLESVVDKFKTVLSY
jgi:hypothetical protein